MAKGHNGETCAEAIKSSIAPSEVVRYSKLCQRTKKCGIWKDATIRRYLMALVVNLPPARDEWENTRPFLFLRGDGQYEIYDNARHPQVID